MFTSFLKAVFDLVCGPSKTKQQEQNQQYPQQQPQQYPQTHPQYPPATHQKPRPQKHEDLNQLNQSDDFYANLRARANEEGDAMAKAFEQSHEAYSRGDGATAKTLSNRGKEHQRHMELLNKQAADWIFIENNKDSKPGEIDLHGLHVKEAISRTDDAIEAAKRRGDSELHLIEPLVDNSAGKGLHSKGGSAKIKPAVEELLQKHCLLAKLDPDNAGVLIVQINSSTDQGVGADEITRRLEHKDEGCFIM
ncbi:hypothetical protein DXG01_006957 [Tephrocybe rancida]|nr:hypothetical protein DXG01_006957 [Tephrocybe rancida]